MAGEGEGGRPKGREGVRERRKETRPSAREIFS